MRKLFFIAALILYTAPAFAKIGFTLEPQVGLSYTDDWRLAAGVKYVEAGKFCSSLMFTRDEYGFSCTRTLNDVLPVKSLQIGVYGVNFFGDMRVGGIVSVDL